MATGGGAMIAVVALLAIVSARRAGGGDLPLQAFRRDGATFPADITLSPVASGAVIAAVRDATARQAAVSEALYIVVSAATADQCAQDRSQLRPRG